MNLNLDLESILGETITAALAPEKLQAAVDKVLEKAVSEAVGDVFGYNSDFRKNLKVQLNGAMPDKFDGLVRFGEVVCGLVEKVVSDAQGGVAGQVVAMVREATGILPPTMKVTELCAELTKRWSEEPEKFSGEDRPTFIIEQVEGICAGQWYLYASPECVHESYECDITMAFGKDGKCYSMRVKGDSSNSTAFKNCVWGIEKYLANIYSGGISIELDKTDLECEFYYPWNN